MATELARRKVAWHRIANGYWALIVDGVIFMIDRRGRISVRKG